MIPLAESWPIALATTLFVEVVVVTVWLLSGPQRRFVATGPLMLLVFGLNLVTHPLAWFARGCDVSWLAVECGVAIVEWIGLAHVPGLSGWKAGLLSLLMNSASAATGLLIAGWGQ